MTTRHRHIKQHQSLAHRPVRRRVYVYYVALSSLRLIVNICDACAIYLTINQKKGRKCDI